MQMTGWSTTFQFFANPRFFERIYRLTFREQRVTLELASRESEVDAAKNYIGQHVFFNVKVILHVSFF